MRVRSIAAVAAFTTMALIGLGATPASAGTGASQACDDNVGYQQIPINTGIVTLGAELGFDPTTHTANWLIVCFSNTPAGTPSTLTGGALWVFFGSNPDGTTNYHVDLYCDDDLGPQTVDLENAPFANCDYDNNVRISFGAGVPVTGPIPCPVSVLGTCLPDVPGITLPIPHISVTVANIYLPLT